MTTPTERHLAVAREAGYAGVEVRAERLLDAPEELRRAAAIVRDGEVWSLNGVRIGLRPDGGLDREALEADLAPRLELCRAMGAAYLLAVPPRQANVDPEAALAGIREGLALSAERASTVGVGVAFEFLGFWDCPVSTPALAGRAVEGLPGVELVLDSCHWHASGSLPLDGFPIERLRMVHLNDAPAKEPARIEDGDRLLPGEGVIQLGRLVDELGRGGYHGPWSLETFNPAYWAADPREIADRGRERLERLLAPAAAVAGGSPDDHPASGGAGRHAATEAGP